jgi:hypothetical protein
MNHALILNFLIICVTIIAMFVLNNPLALFCLLFIKELPYGLDDGDDTDAQGSPMGFGQG